MLTFSTITIPLSEGKYLSALEEWTSNLAKVRANASNLIIVLPHGIGEK